MVGKKRHKGHPQELVKARRAAEYAQAQRDSVGAKGLRAVRRKLKRKERGGVVDKGIIEGITYVSTVAGVASMVRRERNGCSMAAETDELIRQISESTTSTSSTPRIPRCHAQSHPSPRPIEYCDLYT